MGLKSTSPYSTACYADHDFASCGSPLPDDSYSGSTREPGRGSTRGWPSAVNPARNRSMSGGVSRPSSSPESTQAGLRPVTNPFVFSAPCCRHAVHANHSYHIVGYDARKKFRKSVAYRYLRVSQRARRSITLYCSASYIALGLGQKGLNPAWGKRAVWGV